MSPTTWPPAIRYRSCSREFQGRGRDYLAITGHRPLPRARSDHLRAWCVTRLPLQAAVTAITTFVVATLAHRVITAPGRPPSL